MPLGDREGVQTAKPQVRRPAGQTGEAIPLHCNPVSTEGDMTTQTISTVRWSSQRLAAGFISLFIGVSMVFAVGLSHIPAVHNAAHDTRHAIGFPCH
jgi:cobalt transporter subunit CbtB